MRRALVAAGFGDQRPLDLDLGAQPGRGLQPAVAHVLKLAARLAEQVVGIAEPSLLPGGNSGQLQRLRVEHRGALRRAQLIAESGHLAWCSRLVDLVGQRQGDQAAA